MIFFFFFTPSYKKYQHVVRTTYDSKSYIMLSIPKHKCPLNTLEVRKKKNVLNKTKTRNSHLMAIDVYDYIDATADVYVDAEY